MNIGKYLRLIVCVALLWTSLSACSEAEKYTRSECIVRLNFDWEGVSSDKKIDMLDTFAKTYPIAPKRKYNEIAPSSAVQGDDDQFIYLQFKFDCENRVANAKDLVDFVKSRTGLPYSIEVDRRNFSPSIDTISASGKWWVDSDPGIGKPIIKDGKKYIEVK